MVMSSTPHNVCVCSQHANFHFMIDSLKKNFPNLNINNDTVAEITCDTENKMCMVNVLIVLM